MHIASPMRRAIAVLIGIIAGCSALEVSLQMVGMAVRAVQSVHNYRWDASHGVTVLCLGDSMTQNQYPPFLANALHERAPAHRFHVVDEGRGSTMSNYVAEHIERFLDTHRPDIVVVMMGVNDSDTFLPYDPADLSARIKTYKLVRMLAAMAVRVHDRGGLKQEAARIAALRSSREASRGSWQSQAALAHELVRQGSYAEAEPLLRAAIALHAGSVAVYQDMAVILESTGRLRAAIAVMHKAIRLEHADIFSYDLLARLCRQAGDRQKARAVLAAARRRFSGDIPLTQVTLCVDEFDFSAARRFLSAMIGRHPDDAMLLCDAGRFYWQMDDIPMAARLFDAAQQKGNLDCRLKARQFREELRVFCALRNTQESAMARAGARMTEEAYCRLGAFYRDRCMFSNATRVLAGAQAAFPRSSRIRLLQADILMYRGLYDQAAALFASVIRSEPCEYYAYSGLHRLFMLQERKREAAAVYAAWRSRRGSLPDLPRPGGSGAPVLTRASYRTVVDSVRRRGIPLVCVQYPTQPVEALREIVDPLGYTRVRYVSNEIDFKRAVAAGAYSDYFVDFYAGDFGHCTSRGNALIARNVAAGVMSAYETWCDTAADRAP